MPTRFALASWVLLLSTSLGSLAQADSFPNMIGIQFGEAQFLAEKLGIKIDFQKIDSVELRGKILDQIPAGGEAIGKDRRVFVRWSDGIIVPNLAGKPLADAQAELTKLGLNFASSDRRHDGLVKGSVASQVPRANERIDASRQVVFLDLVGGRYVAVPDVNGKHLNDALATIKNGELAGSENPADASFAATPVQESQINCETVRTTTAVASSTEPAAGTELYPGQQVIVRWSKMTSDRNQRSQADECQPEVDDMVDCVRNPAAC
ncbi:PASTA domain-containing protein [Rhizobium johnstonii]|uniref:PASTA domain-containing protein n=1 Tax=Rhizobium TaxID=379 RepID=UPI0010307522|nr:PASTA domain-containing protein [Rhizobium leguminosarum]TBH48346.1 PASTA domain-containing protein [Rhizobium leguminosarum]